jgi:membrane protein DedA with SNARE-associated domain
MDVPVVVVLLLMVVDTTAVVGLLVPSDALVIAAAGGAGGGAPLVAAAAAAGTLLGWSLSWALGVLAGPALRASRAGRWVGEPRWSAAEALLRGDGARILLAVQFLPVVNALVPLLAGTLRVPYGRFLRLGAAGTLAWATVYTGLGALSAAASTALGTDPVVGTLLVGLPGLATGTLVVAGLRRRTAGRGAVPAPVGPGAVPAPVGPGAVPAPVGPGAVPVPVSGAAR